MGSMRRAFMRIKWKGKRRETGRAKHWQVYDRIGFLVHYG
jgi:hypothetical protein